MKKFNCFWVFSAIVSVAFMVLISSVILPGVLLKARASSPLYEENTYVLPQNNANWTASAEDQAGASGVYFDQPSAGLIRIARSGHLYYSADTLLNKLAQFDLKIEPGSDLNGGWAGFVLRPSDPSNLLWAQSSGYRILIFNSSFILSKIGGNDLATAANSTSIADSHMHVIRLGTINEGSAVRIVFEIDGNIIFDYLDGDNPVMNNTSFIHGDCGEVFTTLSFPPVGPVNVPVTGVTVDKESTQLNVGSTETLSAAVAPENATNKSVTWGSSDGNIATVNGSGVVEAVAVGTATITVTTSDGSFSDSCVVTVIPAPTYPEKHTDVSGDKKLLTIVKNAVYDPDSSVLTLGENGLAYYTGSKFTDDFAVFDMQADISDNAWTGFVIRQTDPDKDEFSQNSAYLFTIFKNFIQLHKMDGSSAPTLQSTDSTLFNDGLKHKIRVGSVTEGTNVRIILEIDGNIVINYLDKDNPVTNESYISFVNYGNSVVSLYFKMPDGYDPDAYDGPDDGTGYRGGAINLSGIYNGPNIEDDLNVNPNTGDNNELRIIISLIFIAGITVITSIKRKFGKRLK